MWPAFWAADRGVVWPSLLVCFGLAPLASISFVRVRFPLVAAAIRGVIPLVGWVVFRLAPFWISCLARACWSLFMQVIRARAASFGVMFIPRYSRRPA